MSTRSAVLFLVFNRPDTTARVFDAIRAARPPRLYIAADGPRASRAGEAERCDAVRRIATAVDWPCKVETLFRTENLGCKRAVSSSIGWFFDHETEGIILEDDCVPEPSFFGYCDELLERYRDDPRVTCISGDNFISGTWAPDASYYFSKFAHIWGWATWRRAWQHYDVHMRAWAGTDKQAWLQQQLPGKATAAHHWHGLFDAVAAGRIDTWDYQWQFACWAQGGLNCMPASNLIKNIGFGADATHTVSPESKLANMSTSPVALPLRHPEAVEANLGADAWTIDHVFGLSAASATALTRLRRALKRGAHRLQAAVRG